LSVFNQLYLSPTILYLYYFIYTFIELILLNHGYFISQYLILMSVSFITLFFDIASLMHQIILYQFYLFFIKNLSTIISIN